MSIGKLTIGVFGKINSGKSTLINNLAKENISIVSNVRGTTSDSVEKMTEIAGVGKVLLIDTAGYDDASTLAQERIKSVQKSFDMCDIVLFVAVDRLEKTDNEWIDKCKNTGKKYIVVHNELASKDFFITGNFVQMDVQNQNHIDKLVAEITKLIGVSQGDLLGDLVKETDRVLLVMPQDDGAPDSRLILPQSMIIRQLLDRNIVGFFANEKNFATIYNRYKNDITLIITDSSVFADVYNLVGDNVKITSFSVLFAKHNGDIDEFVKGANMLNKLTDGDKVLIMEVCSHTVSHKDIGEVIIPKLIKKYTGKNIIIEFARGKDEPENYADYKLIVHCGGCMKNRAFMLARINKCRQNGVAITNYGILIAKIKGILDNIVY